MSIDREDYFCNNCHNEFVFDFNLNEGYGQEDVKYCPFCGASYENEMDIDELGFEQKCYCHLQIPTPKNLWMMQRHSTP